MKKLACLVVLAACGGKSTPPPPPPPVDQPTCEDVGEKTGRNITQSMPEGVPADTGAKFGAMMAKLCVDDAWSQELITCAVEAEKPKEECGPKLSTTQREHVDAAQREFAQQLIADMGSGDASDLLDGTGMDKCDAFRQDVYMITQCKAAFDALGEQHVQAMVAGARSLSSVPEDQRTLADGECEAAMKDTASILVQYGCGA